MDIWNWYRDQNLRAYEDLMWDLLEEDTSWGDIAEAMGQINKALFQSWENQYPNHPLANWWRGGI